MNLTPREGDQWLKDLVEGTNPLGDGASMYHDLMGHALQMVNWTELTNAFREEEELEQEGE
jgi:hypothetical protein